jgi:hypothetical protein
VSVDTEASGRAWARAGFTLGAVASLGFNLQDAWLHVADGHAPIAKQAGAVLWPLVLIGTVEVMARIRWPKLDGWRTWGWPLARFGGFGTIGASSAVISYTHVHAVLDEWGYGRFGARAGALCLDGLMILCGFAMLAASRTDEPAVSQDTLPETAGGAVPGQATPGQGGPQLRSALPDQPDLAEGAASDPGTAGREGSASRYGQTPPSPALSLVSGSHQDARSKTAVPAVSGQPSRSAVSVRADSGPDTVAGHLADSQTSGVLASRTDTQDSMSEQPDKVSAALLSGLSVREVARSTGQTKSHVEKRRGELVAAGQLPARGRP